MKKTLMALGGDDTKEEVRDLLNQSDISIIGAKVFNLKANLILAKTSIFKNKKPPPSQAVVHDPPATPKTPQTTEQRLERTRRGIKKSFSMVSVKTKTASKEMANGIANGISNGITKTRSLRNLRSGQQRLENLPDDPVQATSVEKEKTVTVTNGDSAVTNGGEQAASRGDLILSKLPSLEGETVWLSN